MSTRSVSDAGALERLEPECTDSTDRRAAIVGAMSASSADSSARAIAEGASSDLSQSSRWSCFLEDVGALFLESVSDKNDGR